jgi:predicted Zn-ribbon and HTH transcriptional regulator
MAMSFSDRSVVRDSLHDPCQYFGMIDLSPIIERIEALLNEGTDQSVTFAALEARMALEKVCYDRLRQRHDYISQAQLRKWQPGPLINILIKDVDQHLGQTVVVKIGKGEAVEGVTPPDEDFVELGTEMGFDPRRIAKHWNALSNLALHVRIPKDRKDSVPDYGDKIAIMNKVVEVVTELRKIAKGTMTFSGFGPTVSFVCKCGETNKRREKLLRDGQYIHCINADCKITWKAAKEDGGFGFEEVTTPVNCESCKTENHMPWRFYMDMKYDQYGTFSCLQCRHKNYVQWRLTQVAPITRDAAKE